MIVEFLNKFGSATIKEASKRAGRSKITTSKRLSKRVLWKNNAQKRE